MYLPVEPITLRVCGLPSPPGDTLDCFYKHAFLGTPFHAIFKFLDSVSGRAFLPDTGLTPGCLSSQEGSPSPRFSVHFMLPPLDSSDPAPRDTALICICQTCPPEAPSPVSRIWKPFRWREKQLREGVPTST